MTPRHVLNLAAIIFWLIIGAMVVNDNRLVLGSVTLRWPNPASANATFGWSQAPNVVNGQVQIGSGQSGTVQVTVPRAFFTGTLRVEVTGEGLVNVIAATRPGRPTAAAQATGTIPASVALAWADLAANTRTFPVLISNPSPQAVRLHTIILTLRR